MSVRPRLVALILRLASCTAAICLDVDASAQSNSLTTLFARDNGTTVGGAVFFDLTVQTPMTIDAIDVNSNSLAGVTGSLDVHLKSGTHVGFVQTPGAWSLAGSGPMIALGVNLPTTATLSSPIVLSPGIYGVALHYVGLAPAYTNGTVSNQTHANADLLLTAGSSQTTFLSSPPVTPRVANVTIYYTVAPAVPAPVVINEFAYDDTGADDREFVELYNRSGAPFDLSGWKLRYADASGGGDLATIPGGTILPAGGFWLIAQPFWTTRNQTLAAAIPDGAAALSLQNASGTRVDSVTYEEFAGLWPTAPREGSPLFPAFLSTDGFETAWARVRDGIDTNQNADDFRIARATPKASNNLPPAAILTEDGNALAPGAAVPGWYGSHAAPVVVSASTVTVGAGTLPASPQASAPNDRCLQFAAGPNQGASYWLESDAVDQAGFDAYVYLDATPVAAPARQAWSIGIRGGTDSEFAWPVAPGNTVDSNGDRGLTWTYRRDSTGSTLYLIDHGNGGNDEQLLAQFSITTSGWRRLRIEAQGTEVEAWFGGSVGSPTGTLIRRTAGIDAGSMFVGVRNESIAAPLMMDDVRFRYPPIITSVSGGSGCQGNCFSVNGKVTKIAETEKVPQNGVYAFLFRPVGGPVSFDHVCFYTSSSGGSGAQPSVRLLEPDSTVLPRQPSGTVLGSVTGAISSNSEGGSWWAFQVGLSDRSQPFYIELDTQGTIKPPLAAAALNGSGIGFQPQTIDYLQRVNGVWTHPGIKQPWSISFVCATKASDPKAKVASGTLVPGTSFTFTVAGAPASQLLFGALGTTLFVPGIDLTTLGMPGCIGYQSLDVTTFAFSDALGGGTWVIGIPLTVPSGIKVRGQWGVFDSTANALGVVVSDFMDLTIQ